MLPRRRIFRQSRFSVRPGRRAVVLLGLFGFAATLFGLGLPSRLLGSAPREQTLVAAPDEVRVVDGGTLRVRDRTLRLHGLGVPERGTRCTDAAGGAFDCGAAAAAALARLIHDRALACRLHGHDRFGRPLGVCQARPPTASPGVAAAENSGVVALNLALVAGGWAVAEDAAALPALRPAEAEARLAGRGLWAGGAAGPPEAWRGRR